MASHLDAHRVALALFEGAQLGELDRVASLVERTLERGGKVLVFGNGGSAAQAQHFAAELTGRFRRDRAALAALALTTDTSALTAIANDYGYDHVFARQCAALARPGDVAIGLTTSGRSENVLLGLERCRAAGCATVALTGGDGLARDVADVVLASPSADTAVVQELHLLELHLLARLLEEGLARPVLFLDRDGTLVPDVGYPADPARLVLLPGVVEGLRAFQAAGYRLVVVTNQSGIGRGILTWHDVERVNTWLVAELAARGVWLDAVLVCPHAPEAACACRKPGTALYEGWLAGRRVRLGESLMVGDRASDVEAGRRLGVRTVHVRAGTPDERVAADLVVAGLDELSRRLAPLAVVS